jgi:4-amino-4-deoxy-L-arabinose transferase-like glycosyltransferase
MTQNFFVFQCFCGCIAGIAQVPAPLKRDVFLEMNETTMEKNGQIFNAWLLRHGIIAVILLHLALVSINVRQPFVGGDSFGAFYSNIAHNYLQYGFLGTKFGQATNYQFEVVKNASDFKYYQNHPPLWPWTLGVAFKILGEGDAQARLVPIIFSVISLFLLYRLLNLLYGKGIALVAGFLYAILPITAFYGHHPSHESLTVASILGTMLLYHHWASKECVSRFLPLLLVYAVAMITDWPAYLLAALLPAHYILARRKIGRMWSFPATS